MGNYSSRLAFTRPPGQPLPLEGLQCELNDSDSPAPVYLRSTVKAQDLSGATSLSLSGAGYDSEQASRDAGTMWRGVLQRAFAYARAGSDFGDRREGGLRFAEATQRAMDEAAGTTVLAHKHGLMTFETHPSPEFISITGEAYAVPFRERLETALASDLERLPVGTKEHMAHTLYGASFFVRTSPEARFILLMMAVEALMKPERRSPAARAHLDAMLSVIESATDLDPDEKEKLGSGLHLLKKESLTRTGRRLAESLADRTYADMPAVDFFSLAYKIRSRLVHSSGAGVNVTEVEALIGPLGDFVGDLLSGPALLAQP